MASLQAVQTSRSQTHQARHSTSETCKHTAALSVQTFPRHHCDPNLTTLSSLTCLDAPSPPRSHHSPDFHPPILDPAHATQPDDDPAEDPNTQPSLCKNVVFRDLNRDDGANDHAQDGEEEHVAEEVDFGNDS